MMPSVKQREVRPTAHQKRMRDFKESAYQTLRRHQRGEFEATTGVVAGQLDIALTQVLDSISAAADRIFPHRSGGDERKAKEDSND